jgi:hypothetical protein
VNGCVLRLRALEQQLALGFRLKVGPLPADERENVAVGILEPCGFHLARDVDVEFFLRP